MEITSAIRIKGLQVDRETCRNCLGQDVKCFLAFLHIETPEGSPNVRVCDLFCSESCCEAFKISQIGFGPSCSSCGAPHSGLKCEVCLCTYYCGEGCRTRHHDAHASICTIINPVFERSLTTQITKEKVAGGSPS
jgi:hypothetical protein